MSKPLKTIKVAMGCSECGYLGKPSEFEEATCMHCQSNNLYCPKCNEAFPLDSGFDAMVSAFNSPFPHFQKAQSEFLEEFIDQNVKSMLKKRYNIFKKQFYDNRLQDELKEFYFIIMFSLNWKLQNMMIVKHFMPTETIVMISFSAGIILSHDFETTYKNLKYQLTTKLENTNIITMDE